MTSARMARVALLRQLPHPPLSPLVRRAIELAIVEAWDRLSPDLAKGRLGATEVSINTRLVSLLNQMRDHPSPGSAFTASVFQTVVRGGELVSYNGRKLEKRPDMAFRL